MTSAQVVSHRLDDGIRDLLGKDVAENVGPDLDPDAQQAILARIGAHALSRHLPGEILTALRLFPATGRHALLLRNLPLGDLPPTPVTGFGAEADLAEINALHLGLIQLLGLTPFSVGYENNGRLMRNVVPNPAATGITSSWGADSEFFWHTDNPHLPFGSPGGDPRLSVPRYLTFYGMRNEERVPTEIAAIEDAVRPIDDALQVRLHSPSYDVGPPASVRADSADRGGPAALCGTALLERSVDGSRARYDRGTVTAHGDDDAEALDSWVRALAEMPRVELVLEPGDFLIFDNYRVLHRRRAFGPGPLATARWLRRCYAS